MEEQLQQVTPKQLQDLIKLGWDWWDEESNTPTVALVFKWFRDNYGLKHDIDDNNIGTNFYYKIKSYTKKFDNYDILTLIRREREWNKIEFKTYEEAELACLDKLIEVAKVSIKLK